MPYSLSFFCADDVPAVSDGAIPGATGPVATAPGVSAPGPSGSAPMDIDVEDAIDLDSGASDAGDDSPAKPKGKRARKDSPGAGAKGGKARLHSSTQTLDPTVIASWMDINEHTHMPLRQHLFGWHEGATAKQLETAAAHVKGAGGVYCYICGNRLQSHKRVVSSHLTSDRCKNMFSDNKPRFNGALIELHIPKEVTPGIMKSSEAAALVAAEAVRKEREDIVSILALSQDIGYSTAAHMFSRNAPFLNLILALGHLGIGSDKTVAGHADTALLNLETTRLKPQVRDAIARHLPLAIMVDESSSKTGKGCSTTLVFLFWPGLVKPICVNAVVQKKTPTSAEVRRLIRFYCILTVLMLTALRNGSSSRCSSLRQVNKIIHKALVPFYMTEKELDAYVVVHCSDHCSVMISSAKLSFRTFRGDPPHAFALVIKAMLKACGLKDDLMLVRFILARPNSLQMKNLLAGFQVSRASFDMPTTRWGFWPQILAALNNSVTLARVQQILQYLLSKMTKVKTRAKSKKVPLEVSDEDEDWGEYGGDDHEDSLFDDDGAATAPASGEKLSKQEKLKRDIQQLLSSLTDPAFLCRVRVAVIMVSKIKTANKELQTSTLSKMTLKCLADVVTHFRKLNNVETRDAMLEPAKAFLKDSRDPMKGNRPHSLVANVVFADDGSVTVPNIGEITEPTFTQLDGITQEQKAAVDNQVWKTQLQNAVLVYNAGIGMYNKWVQPLVLSAERRHIAKLYTIASTKEFHDLSDCPDAWPEATSSNATEEDSAAAGADAGAGASAGKTEDTYFTWAPPPAARAYEDDDSQVKYKPEDLACMQYEEFHYKSSSLTPKDKDDPTAYWIGMRPTWPVLSELMLFWLASPVSTSDIERSFSFQTMIDSDTRRRCLQPGHLRAGLLAHIHKDLFEERANQLRR